MNNMNKGFSLIELLIVVVIIGILAAIAIPGLLASKRSTNEGSVVSSLRILHGAQMTYASSFGVGEFAGDIGSGTLTSLSALGSLKLIDDVLGSGTKSGYNLVGAREVASTTLPSQFFFSAIPISSDLITRTGNHRYGISTDGVMRSDDIITLHYANVANVATATPMGN